MECCETVKEQIGRIACRRSSAFSKVLSLFRSMFHKSSLAILHRTSHYCFHLFQVVEDTATKACNCALAYHAKKNCAHNSVISGEREFPSDLSTSAFWTLTPDRNLPQNVCKMLVRRWGGARSILVQYSTACNVYSSIGYNAARLANWRGAFHVVTNVARESPSSARSNCTSHSDELCHSAIACYKIGGFVLKYRSPCVILIPISIFVSLSSSID